MLFITIILLKNRIYYRSESEAMEQETKWIFPDNIKFDEVPQYVERLKEHDLNKRIIFDLSETVNMHSSFIGFLIHARYNIKNDGGTLLLHLSFTVEKILTMLNILDYFSPETITILKKKTA